MPTKNLRNTPDIVPAITYSNLPSAVEWFERVFGFRERVEARITWQDGAMAWMELGNGLFCIKTPDDTWWQTHFAGPGVTIKVYVDNVDQHFSHATTEGARIVADLQDGFWGGRFYRALDHEGNLWELSQSGVDLAPEEWQLPPGMMRGVPK